MPPQLPGPVAASSKLPRSPLYQEKKGHLVLQAPPVGYSIRHRGQTPHNIVQTQKIFSGGGNLRRTRRLLAPSTLPCCLHSIYVLLPISPSPAAAKSCTQFSSSAVRSGGVLCTQHCAPSQPRLLRPRPPPPSPSVPYDMQGGKSTHRVSCFAGKLSSS